jgi:hypothetical protein
MILRKRLGFELLQRALYLCRIQFHARLLQFASWLVDDRMGGFGRKRLLPAKDTRRQEILIARPRQRSTLVRKFFFNPRAVRIEPGTMVPVCARSTRQRD